MPPWTTRSPTGLLRGCDSRVTGTTDGLTDKIEVKVLVTGVNEPPVISGEASPTFNEDALASATRVARYSATDPERDSFDLVGGGYRR